MFRLVTSSNFIGKRSLYVWPSKNISEVVKTKTTENELRSEPRIYGVKISQHADRCYGISVRHTGHFRLKDYEEIDFEVKSVKLVRRT